MSLLDPDALREAYEDWKVRIGQMHDHANPQRNETADLHHPAKPRSRWRVGLLTTAGAHVDGQEPFDITSPHGDASLREIPDDVAMSDIRFSHGHYDTTRAEDDPNVVLPIEPLRALVDDGDIGSASPVHVGMMGWNPDPTDVIRSGAPAVVDMFASHDVDVVVMSPG
ncbi:MAG: glycine/sarcosine/betaine reductase selenoprotein B family protein [Nitriliruptoraceae bacterium]